jgi:hypothetical protein
VICGARFALIESLTAYGTFTSLQIRARICILGTSMEKSRVVFRIGTYKPLFEGLTTCKTYKSFEILQCRPEFSFDLGLDFVRL